MRAVLVIMISLMFLSRVPPTMAEELCWPMCSCGNCDEFLSPIAADILKVLPEGDKEYLRGISRRELFKHHHGWGTGIRNAYRLNDDLSMRVMELVWEAVQEE